MIGLLDRVPNAAVLPGYTNMGYRLRRRAWSDAELRTDGRSRRARDGRNGRPRAGDGHGPRPTRSQRPDAGAQRRARGACARGRSSRARATTTSRWCRATSATSAACPRPGRRPASTAPSCTSCSAGCTRAERRELLLHAYGFSSASRKRSLVHAATMRPRYVFGCTSMVRHKGQPRSSPLPVSVSLGRGTRAPTAGSATHSSAYATPSVAPSPRSRTLRPQHQPAATPSQLLPPTSPRRRLPPRPQHARSEADKRRPHTFAPTDALAVVCSCMRLFRPASDPFTLALSLGGAA